MPFTVPARYREDLMPTLPRLAGVPVPEEVGGRDLRPTSHDRPVREHLHGELGAGDPTLVGAGRDQRVSRAGSLLR
ncbi:hypothetical protein V1260_11770 [Brachybacterium sp. J144]|uniref:hypothetical protein n=1 Tax=Brachybacterium sp. J144 TaxID=3116487 RepID=UPI002E791513|nr:hypothetical protein [Brachybacterium sp. J144]MEE1651459.1 hypothetical protein [Brachybacterium sp. J144]